MNNKSIRLSLLAAACLALTACGSYQGLQDVQMTSDAGTLRAEKYTRVVTDKVIDSDAHRESMQDVDAPWLAGKSVPLAREVTLPPLLRTRLHLSGTTMDALGRTKITALTAECNPSTYTVQRLAGCITSLIGVPVRIRPEALLPGAQFSPRRGGGGGAAPATSTGGGAGQETLSVAPVEMELNTLLDLADATWGVSHRVTDNGTIEIFRIETRVLRLKALAQKVTSKVTSSAGFDAGSTTTYENLAVDAMASMKATLLAMGTVAGTVDINPESKSVVVSDTPEAIDRMEKYIDTENKRLTRRITLVFEELFITNKHGREASIDWSLLYGKVGGTPNTIGSPATLAGPNAASAGFAVRGTGPFAGSSLLLKALDEMGLIVTRRTFPISTLNGNAATIGLPTIFDYVAQITNNAVTNTAGSVSAPTVNQKEDKYGAFLTVTPEAQDDGQVLISVNLADRTGTLTPYTVQVSGSGTTVQQRNIQETNLTGRTVLRTGVTHVIGGLDEALNASTRRRLDDNAPIVLGGSDAVNQSSRRIMLLVTAIAEDNI